MQFVPTEIADVYLVKPHAHADHRGAFARLYCPQEFADAGISSFAPAQVNLSRNTASHTLRGMHYQNAPYEEAKLVHVSRGAIFDVAVDLRPHSPTYKVWTGHMLSAQDMNALYVPQGCAHGFLTLEPETDVLYHMGSLFVPGQGEGFRWDDPSFDIVWPAMPEVMSDRDATYPNWIA